MFYLCDVSSLIISRETPPSITHNEAEMPTAIMIEIGRIIFVEYKQLSKKRTNRTIKMGRTLTYPNNNQTVIIILTREKHIKVFFKTNPSME